jgi:TonB family protein
MVRMATPENPRLPFLDAQLSQLQYRSTLDDARAAIRDKRFEDAATLLANARSFAVPDSSEVSVLAEELARSRSEQRIDEVLALAATRLEEGKLTSPANDNARYYYELALGNDAANTAAQQGLIFVASQLVLKARAAIDNGQFDQAAELIGDARELDPNNSELVASTAALQTARKAQTDAALRVERERQAELERQAEAARQAEVERQAELERQAAAERAAEAERIAEEQRQAESRRQAAAAAAIAAAATVQSGRGAGGEPTSGVLKASEPAGNTALQSADGSSKPTAPESEAAPASTLASEQTVAALSSGESAGAVVSPDTESARAVASPASELPAMVSVSTLTRVHYVSPKYPRNAMRRGTTGFVDLTLTIARDGSVYNVIVQSAEPGTTFNEAAIEAVSQWRFDPVIEGGVPVEKRTAVRMAFELQE